jgi:phosphate transport system substrate-binding protein
MVSVFGIAMVLSMPLASCSSPSGNDGAARSQLVLTGSSTVAPLAAEIGKRFETQHPGVRVDVQTGGSSRGIADARRGLADIGMASRALNPAENDLLAFSIARDGICLIVHRDNPVQSLSDEQVVAIYTGRVENWKDVGGSDAPITVVNKAEGRSTLELFLTYFKLDSADVQADVVIGDNEQGMKTVAGNSNAIGYVSLGTAAYDAKHAIPIKLLPVGGVAASVQNVADGNFPLSRPLNLVTREVPTGLVREFIEFAQSDAVHDLIREQYFVPISP